jgi:hypothetical protein
MNVSEQKKRLLEKMGSGGSTKIGYSSRTISMNTIKVNKAKSSNKDCKGCSRKSGKT